MSTPTSQGTAPSDSVASPRLRVLLVSTYDLGRQPFGLASPAAWLRRAGAHVTCNDLAVEPLDEAAVRAADLVAFHLPMHTATRVAIAQLERVRTLRPDARVCCFGLYAPMNERHLRGLGVDVIFGGEFEEGLVGFAEHLSARVAGRDAGEWCERPTISLARQAFIVPDRSGLPALSHYAHLHDAQGQQRTTGYTEASRGCKHKCRHCPVVPVYNGHFRVVARDVVLDDVRRQVEAGAEHITFGDPDFFNGIGHAVPIVQALHDAFPDVTYDVTIKVEHLLQHRQHLDTLRDTGCLFVTSAVESVDDAVLERLDKRHTRADFFEVAGLFRRHRLTLHPTFVAFMPWTTVRGFQALLATVAELDLVEHVAPVQWGIRLLIPHGSKLLELPEFRSIAGVFDEAALVHPWTHADPAVDALQSAVMETVREALAQGRSRGDIFERVWQLAAHATGADARPYPAAASRAGRAPVPYLSEPWYC